MNISSPSLVHQYFLKAESTTFRESDHPNKEINMKMIKQVYGRKGKRREKKQELRAHMALVTRSEEPRANMT